ncbi:katanin p80 WD40 repeat-containing subunit B1-like isoform X2 [Oscarella lobularis]|uniref:katanin p80 WD40 repeat-containing subunit B1-like isoform X2 n=1 Tax=Oscarella lobularis TaxID=121494 RepID=UPI0033139EB8
MTATTKRAWKLQDFVAHSSNVNCLAIGQQSGRVLATGGDDRKVNIWAVGKPNNILSLTGHTSPVECVRFDPSEEIVMAGSRSGSLKLWNLNEQKIIRTLTGHKSEVKCLDVHPYGDFVASGSLDTNIKVWDVRRKGCIFTYRGHTDSVNCLRISPDGRWVMSCSNDCTVRLWDMTAGKVLNVFKGHVGPVNWVEFHPNEFLMTSGSSDRTVKFWDLENFNLVSSTEPDARSVACVKFHPEGTPLFGGGEDSLKLYSWEPSVCLDAVPVGWMKVSDMAISKEQLIGASFYQTNVAVWVVDLTKLRPFNGEKVPSQAHLAVDKETKRSLSGSGRRSFAQEKPTSPPPSPEKGSHENAEPPYQDPAEGEEIFMSKTRLQRTPPKVYDPFPPPPEDPIEIQVLKKPSIQRPKTTSTTTRTSKSHQSEETTGGEVKKSTLIPENRDKPAGLDIEEFLPKPRQRQQQQPDQKSSRLTDESALRKMKQGHEAMISVLATRYNHLRTIRSSWSASDVREAVSVAVRIDDDSAVVDLLEILCLKNSFWNLEVCCILLPRLLVLIQAKFDNYVLMACKVVKLILTNFSEVIKSNVGADSVGSVDINKEERIRKCRTCHAHLTSIQEAVNDRHSSVKAGKLGSFLRDLKVAFTLLD